MLSKAFSKTYSEYETIKHYLKKKKARKKEKTFQSTNKKKNGGADEKGQVLGKFQGSGV